MTKLTSATSHPPTARKTHLGQVLTLLTCRVSSSNDGKGLVPEDGDGSVAHCARRDTALPVRVFSREV